MKRLVVVILTFGLLFALAACDNSDSSKYDDMYLEDQITEDFAIPLGETGAKVVIPAEMGFERYESQLNDFFGGGPSGEWAIIANTEPKSDFPDCTLADYASLVAQANEGEVAQDADGNYYYIHVQEVEGDEFYKYYSAIREGKDKYYRISFYCFEKNWEHYGEKFAEWAATIVVE